MTSETLTELRTRFVRETEEYLNHHLHPTPAANPILPDGPEAEPPCQGPSHGTTSLPMLAETQHHEPPHSTVCARVAGAA